MGEWTEGLEALRRQLVERAAQMTARLQGRPGFPDPEDLAQEVLARLLGAYGADRLRGWAMPRLRAVALRALHNLVVDHARRKIVEVGLPEGSPAADPPEGRPGPEEAVATREILGIFRRCLGTVLSEDERRFVALSFELDSAPAAQERLGWPPGPPEGSRLCHLRARLVGRVLRCFEERLGSPAAPRGPGKR